MKITKRERMMAEDRLRRQMGAVADLGSFAMPDDPAAFCDEVAAILRSYSITPGEFMEMDSAPGLFGGYGEWHGILRTFRNSGNPFAALAAK